MNPKNLIFSLFLLLLTALPALSDVQAQHRAQIESANQRGDHFEALLTLDKVSKRKLNGDSHLAAAKSAWALSLPDRALTEFEAASNDTQLSLEQSLQARFSKAVLHFQEGRADEALIQSQKLLELLKDSSPLRARVHVLAGQSLIRMGSKAQAETELLKAFGDASYLERSDIAYQLAELQNQLGKWDEAKQYLRTIGEDDERAAEALRLLSQICLARNEYEDAERWITQGRQQFPEQFNDSWTFYARGVLAAQKNDETSLLQVVTEAQQKFAPSDPWLTILDAEQEAFLAAPLKARLNKIEEEHRS